MRHPIKIDSVADWLNRNLKTEGERAQVIYFLTGLAMLDGTLSRRELQFLDVINKKLGLTANNLERIVSMYANYYASQEHEKTKTKKENTTISLEKRYADILHLPPSPELADLKKSYRSLVKQHHPDRFNQASDAQQLLAKEKFQQIQEAYEFWMKKLQD
jgi:DnaJ like chaperone protein